MAPKRKRRRSTGDKADGPGTKTVNLSVPVCDPHFAACISLAAREAYGHCPPALHHQVALLSDGILRSLSRPSDPAASFLLIGPPGACKMAVAREALRSVFANQESPPFVEIILDGLLHSDSSLGVFRGLASALVDLSTFGDAFNPGQALPSQQTCNAIVSQAISKLVSEDKGVVFLVSDFDRFATPGGVHSALYKVFNLLQDTTLRGVFIGTTCHHDSVDGLEKRVKSRFLPVEISVPGLNVLGVKDVLNFLKSCTCLPERTAKPHKQSRKLSHGLKSSTALVTDIPSESIRLYNSVVCTFLCSSQTRESVSRFLAGDGDIERLVSAVLDSISVLVTRSVFTRRVVCDMVQENQTVHSVFDACLRTAVSSVSQCLLGLSTLEFTLLLAFRKVQRSQGSEARLHASVVFGDVYDEYASLRRGGGKGFVSTGESEEGVVNRSIAEKAWGRLMESALVMQIGSGPNTSRSAHLCLADADLTKALKQRTSVSALVERWSKDIVD